MKFVLTAVVLLSIACTVVAQSPNTPASLSGDGTAGQARRLALKSPEFGTDGAVTFRLLAPRAGTVAVTGDWQEPNAAPIGMQKGDDGVWTTTVTGLKPELRVYNFLVDGVSMLDPANIYVMRNGVRFLSALMVPGEQTDLYKIRDVPHGEVSALWYPSPTLGMTQRRMTVYTPPGYENSTRRYPVLYLLHGGGSDEDAWDDMGHAIQIFDNLISMGKATPMIVVMPNGHYNQTAAPGVTEQAPSVAMDPALGAGGLGSAQMKFAPSVVPDIVPYIDKHFRTLSDRNHRAVAGLSMGGAHAALVGLNNLDTFSYVGLFSAGFPLMPGALKLVPVPATTTLRGPGIGQELNLSGLNADFPKLNESYAAKMHLLYISCGGNDGLITSNLQFMNWLKSKDVKFEKMTLPDYVHEWAIWRISLAEFTQKIFT